MTEILARRFDTLEPVKIEVVGGRIASISTLKISADDAENLPYVSPGFFDIQINGYEGTWFCSPNLTVQAIESVTTALVKQGITRFFPTLITASFDALYHGFSTLSRAVEENALVGATVAGFHLEGPFISAEDGPRGAHPIEHVRAADYDEFSKLQEAAGGRIRLVTLAAEAENAVPFIQRCQTDGIVVALGHTGASPEQILAAVEAGAKLSTHFGNGAHGLLPRHPNYLWEQLANDKLWASVIADGWHLPESVLKCVLKCKTTSRTVLTCDVSGFAGCASGTYQEGDVEVEVLDDGRIVVAGQRQYLAGSGATTGDCIAHMVQSCGVSLSDAIAMATDNPARLMNERLPALKAGEAATFSVFNVFDDTSTGGSKKRFQAVQTFVNGIPYS